MRIQLSVWLRSACFARYAPRPSYVIIRMYAVPLHFCLYEMIFLLLCAVQFTVNILPIVLPCVGGLFVIGFAAYVINRYAARCLYGSVGLPRWLPCIFLHKTALVLYWFHFR